jgi:drug/metabolite transporter (DMT)-like permease
VNTTRNIAIVLGLALVVWLVPGGGESASFIGQVMYAVFTVAIVAIGARLYRQFRPELFSLGDRWRGVLYGSVAVLLLTLAASRRLFDQGGAGALVWFALMGGASYALYATWRAYRAYA